MKKTFFLSMLAAALLGGQACADAILTKVEGYSYKLGNNQYIGVLDENASEGKVTVSYSADGSDMSGAIVYGGLGTSATNNTVIMTGGEVSELIGGDGMNSATGNVVIVAGDSKVGMFMRGGNAKSASSQDNKVYLVGNGATATIADAQGNMGTYTGGNVSLGVVLVGGDGRDRSGNSIDIYGTGIEAKELGRMQILNFHLLSGQLASTAPMVTITEADGFTIRNGLDLSFDAVEGMEWKPGDSVTLVEAHKGMSIAPEVLAKEYDIYQNGDPQKTVMATAKLTIEQGQGTTQFLKLVVPRVPEPTTGTFSLLALAGLAARRRKK